MDIKDIKDLEKFEDGGKKQDYDASKSGELHPFVEKEYSKSKKDSEKTGSPFVTTSYKKFLDRYKKTYSKNSKIINEDLDITRGGIEIEISKNYKDEYNVTYVYQEDDNFYQFSGNLVSYNTGRNTEYTFEPSWFMDDESEKFYSDNWEMIEDQILNKFYE